MEGPTPVSALIHAATMVTAGVYMVARCNVFFRISHEWALKSLGENPSVWGLLTHDASFVVAVVGGITAFVAATIGLAQTDIKKVLAYSTVSQLGYMFLGCGVLAFSAGMFHVFTHAWFKACLFLGAGSVIHAMSNEQDIRKMGGIWRKIPITYALMWIGSLALAGVPFFAGYYSKDFVLEAAFAAHSGVGMYAFACGIIAAFLTAFYSWRLIILTFHGAPRADHHTMEHVHESPWVMLAPLLVLAAGAIGIGALFAENFVGHHWEQFWNGAIVNAPHNHIMHAVHEVPSWVPLAPTVVGLSGIALAYVLYMFAPSIPGKLANSFGGLYRFLLNKWYFDELYDAIFVKPTRALARVLWQKVDAGMIDGVPNGAADLAADVARGAVRLQTGRVANYAFTMIAGLAVFVTLLAFGAAR
jgi:NADH-quinone oxidoreductase subunit L